MASIPGKINKDNFNVLLLGRTGLGKSATGNTILQNNVFESKHSLDSVTEKCRKQTNVVDGITINVVDTPGTMDTRYPEESLKEIVNAINLCPEGFDAVFIVLKLGDRFTENEQEAINQLKGLFGDSLMQHTILVFTHAEEFRKKTDVPFTTYIKETKNPPLQQLLQECGERCTLIENDPKSFIDAWKLITMVKDLVATHHNEKYTNKYFRQAQSLLEQNVSEAKRQEQIYIHIQNDHNECFPGNTYVTTENYKKIALKDLTVGEKVLVGSHTGKLTFSEIYLFGHTLRNEKSFFIVLKTMGHLLKVTPGHHVYISRFGKTTTVPANKVKIGDSLLTVSQNEETLTSEEVEQISIIEDQGLYAPFTMSGSIVVDGVLASCYVDVVPPHVAHPLLSPVRQLYKMSPSTLAAISRTSDEGMPWWIEWCLKLAFPGKNGSTCVSDRDISFRTQI